MKIIKPMTLSLLHKTYTFNGQHYFVITPVCFFRLGTQKTENPLLVEMPQWAVMQKYLAATEIFDMAMPKPKGEVLVAGSAHAPNSEPVKSMKIRLALGAVDKTLGVIGNRTWRSGLMPMQQVSDPEPFVTMPISWDRAYGGKSYGDNPAGKGHMGSGKYWRGTSLTAELPNVVDPLRIVNDVRSNHCPVGLRPIDITLPQRSKKAGTYSQSWLKNHFPGYAPDMDWSIFNAGSPNQQISGYWQGGESYCIEGMHPQYQTLNGQLPDIRARAFIARKTGEFSEIPTVADTVWMFPESLLGVMLFRGQVLVNDSDALDVNSMMVSYENNLDAARSLDHYENVLTLRTNLKTALANAFNESQLTPEKNALQQQKEANEQAEALAKQQAVQKEFVADMLVKQNLPVALELPEPPVNLLPVIAPQAIARGDFDLTEFIEKGEQLARQVKEQGEQQLAELEDKQQTLVKQLDSLLSDETKQLQVQMHKRQQLEDMKAALLHQPDKFASAQKTDPTHKPLPGNSDQPDDRSGPANQNSTLPDPNMGRRYALHADKKHAELADEVKQVQRQQVKELLILQRTLAGRDIAGADLKGLDFSYCDLREVMLEHADLRGCNFSHANLRGAVLAEARLDNCDFTAANFTEANLCKASAIQANFSACVFDKAMLMEASLQSCKFNQSVWTGTLANQINCNHSDFSDSRFERCVLVQGQFMDTDFSDAQIRESLILDANLSYSRCEGISIHRSALIKSRGQLINLRDAKLSAVQFGTLSDFAKASFAGAKCEQCGMRKMDLRGVDLRNAQFRQCDLGESDLRGANIVDAKIIESVLSGANLSVSDCMNVNFYRSLGRKTVAEYTRFEYCDFLHMDWQQARWVKCEQNNNTNLNETAMEVLK